MTLAGLVPKLVIPLLAVALVYWRSRRNSQGDAGDAALDSAAQPDSGQPVLNETAIRFLALSEELRKSWPLSHLPFTPLLTCEPEVSFLMDRFDWRIHPGKGYDANKDNPCTSVEGKPWLVDVARQDPRVVWVAPHGIQKLLDLAASRLGPDRKDRVVVISGTEMPLSRAFGRDEAERNATLAKLQRYFGRIVYQTKDIPLAGVAIAPMGLSWGYVLSALRRWIENEPTPENIVKSVIQFGFTLSVNISVKTLGILACRGKVARWLDRNDTPGVLKGFADRGQLVQPSNSSIRACHGAWDSRARMRRFAQSPEGRRAGVELRALDFDAYWTELPKYRFLLSPLGSGIQTAKSIEALMVLTIPIVQRWGFGTYDDLVALGFPFVLVTGWTEVTAANTSRWWQALSPRLESFRRNCLTVDGYWSMYIGQVSFCQ